MNSLVVALYLYILINCVNCVHDTTCSEDQKHFAEVCFTPTVLKDYDVDWFVNAEPQGGWYYVLGNDIHRLHFSELVQGKLLTLQDNFQNSCFRFQTSSMGNYFEANITGHENGHGTWHCKLSKDTEGLYICDGRTGGPSKYHEFFHSYPVFTNNKSFVISIYCFPNGQAGWTTLATKPELTEDEKKIISEEVEKIGFSFEDHVVTYDKACSN